MEIKINWENVWNVYDIMKANAGWMDKIKKNGRQFYDIYPAACRQAKVKLNELERFELYRKVLNSLRD